MSLTSTLLTSDTSDTMNALVYMGPQTLHYRPEPLPKAAFQTDTDEAAPTTDAEVLVKVHYAGICGSDMHAYLGHDARRKPPLILGHEIAGVIASGPHEGRAVVINPLISCHQCDACLEGRANLCPHRTMLGMTRPGGFAEYVRVPFKNIIEVEEGVKLEHAALTEPAATVLHALKLIQRVMWRPLPEARTLVIGGGAIGMLSTLLLWKFGVHDLTVSEPHQARRQQLAQEADINLHNPSQRALPDDAFDVIIDAVGLGITRQSAVKSVKPGGVIMHIGLGESSSVLDARKLTLGEVMFLGSYTYNMTDMRETLKAISRGDLGDFSWVECRPLSEGPQAFQTLHEGGAQAAKILLAPSS